MRRSPLLLSLLAASAISATATARPTVVGRVGLVAAGSLGADALTAGPRDGRAAVTVHVAGGADRLRRAGLDAHALTASIAELRATPDDLRRLLALPDVVTVEERRILRPLLDASGPAVGANAARAETGIDGAGALVAVVDTGVDFRHADLRHADGTTRIAAILDFANPRGNLHPELADYNGGALWLTGDIDGTLAAEAAGTTPAVPVLERDTNGHGTHVIGITASNGFATGNGLPAGRYVGMAPGADVIAVQATHGDATFTDSDVVMGCRFAIDYAAQLGRPVVVNLSLGSNAGPHDGTSDLEVALDELFAANEPGRAVVVASGNEGARDQHAGGWALDGRVTIPVELASSSQADSRLSFEAWHDGGFTVTVTSPAGHTYGPVKTGAIFNGPMTSEGQVLVFNGGTEVTRTDGRSTANVAIEGPAGGAPAAGRWTLAFDGHATRWDVWITDEPGAATPAHFVDQVSVDDRLDMPATAQNAIVVGSFVTRNQWTTIDGTPVARTQVVGAPSAFSSSGPTVDGRFAPDVVAPGEYVVSALSRDAPPDNPASAFFAGPGNHLTWADDGVHGVLRGTSQAAPHVTGAIALLLQADPTLTANAIRELLRVTANDVGGGFTPKLGFGKLDVLAAVRYARGGRGASVSATASSVGVSRDLIPPGDSMTTVTVTPRDAAGTPLGAGHVVTITASAGDAIGDVVDVGSGRYERTFVAHARRGTTAIVTASVDGVQLAAHPSIYIVTSRADIGGAFAAGGGCSFTAARTSSPEVLGAVLAFLAVLAVRAAAGKSRRRRRGRTLQV